jgi:hypothetical protein
MRAFPNPFSPRVEACVVCHGQRHVYRPDYSAAPCPNCGCSCTPRTDREKAAGMGVPSCQNDEKFRRLEADAFIANHVRPTLTKDDLSEKERRIVTDWRLQFPKTSILTFLSWIEGLRFTAEAALADRQFQREMFAAEGQWKEYRDAEAEGTR